VVRRGDDAGPDDVAPGETARSVSAELYDPADERLQTPSFSAFGPKEMNGKPRY